MIYKTAGFKRAFVLVVLACALVAASSVIYWRQINNRLAQDAREAVLAVSRDSAENLNRLLGAQLQVLTALAISLEDRPLAGVNRDLANYLNRQNRRNSFELTGIQFPDGTALFSNGRTQEHFLSKEDVSFVYEHSHFISSLRPNPFGEDQIVVLAVPLRENRVKKGVVFATLSEAFYSEALSSGPLAGTGLSLIVSSSGQTLISYPSGISSNVFDVATRAVFDPGRSAEQMRQDFAARKSGLTGYELGEEHRFSSYYPLGYNDWYAVAVLPTASVAEKAQFLILMSLLSCASVIGILGLLLVFILRQRLQNNRALYNMGFVDPLTKADNLNAFQLKYPKSTAFFKKTDTPFALAVINVNRFKAVNDLYGFEQGDYILKQIADALRAELQEGELFCRLGADVFLLLLACPSRAQLGRRVEELLPRAGRYCKAGGECLPLSLTCGLYCIDEDVPFFILMDRANVALAEAKGRAGHSYAFYESKYLRKMVDENRIESSMARSLENEEFKIYLQPKCDFATGRIKSAEALVRWVHPERGMIPPDGFIPVFEKNGFVVKLDLFMLDKTLALLKTWRESGLPVVPVGVNFSRLHLDNPHFIDDLATAADRYGVPHNLLEVELTENVVFVDMARIKEVINGLHKQGFSVAMDDFGSAYSSLNVLKDLDFNCIKLDKEFLARGENNPRLRQIISGVVKMIKSLGCKVVAEGVETREQVDFLQSLDCDLAQGYFFYKPLPKEEFEARLKEQASQEA